jgi:hypothetical protein
VWAVREAAIANGTRRECSCRVRFQIPAGCYAERAEIFAARTRQRVFVRGDYTGKDVARRFPFADHSTTLYGSQESLTAACPNDSRQFLGRYVAPFFRSRSEQHSGLVAAFWYAISADIKVCQGYLGRDITFLDCRP